MCFARLVLLLLVMPATVGAPAASAAADGVTGGATVPDERFSGGAADGDSPAPAPLAAQSARERQGTPPPASAAQDGDPETRPPAQAPPPEPEPAPGAEPDRGALDVQVPLQERPATGAGPPPPVAEPRGSLARTGYPVLALSAIGLSLAGTGLTLRRLTRG